MTNDLAALNEALDRALADPWNRGLGDAHLALEKAVFSEYRAGRLVQIDEGMRERVVDALRMTSDLSIVECAEVAPAVIAAMMGGAK